MTKTLVNTFAFFIFSTTLVAVQMEMPSSPPANGKSAGTKTLTGVVSDSMWGAKHMAKDKSAAECARMCIKQVSKTLIPASGE